MSKQITITRDGSYQDIDAGELEAFVDAGWVQAADSQGGATVMPESRPDAPSSDWPGEQTPPAKPKAKPARKAQTPGSHKPKGKGKA